MVYISDLASIDTLSSGDQLLIYNTNNGDERRASLNSLLTFFNQNNVGGFTKQYSIANDDITIYDNQQNIWVIITPVATVTNQLFIMPNVNNILDGQEFIITSTQAISSITYALNGSIGAGLPTSMNANTSFRLKFDQLTKIYYKVG